MRKGLLGFAIIGALLALTRSADANATSGSARVQYHVLPSVSITVTPNYHTGYGAVPARIGGSSPTPNPGLASAVDFNSVAQGSIYLYRYAAHVNVSSTGSYFQLYAEGTADLTGSGTAAGSTMALPQTLFWLNSTNSTDTNTGFSPSQPFQKTVNPVTGSTITYPPYPSGGPIYTSTVPVADLYYDYQLKVPSTATLGQYNVYVVYTAVPF